MKEFVMQETEEMTTFGSVWKRYEPVAELVRCKECRWGDWSRNGKGEEMILCYNGDTGIEDGYLHEPDWFCADGVAKDINVLGNEGR